MGGSLPLSVFPSTIPTMKKPSEMYKMYRELPIYEALYSSMLELGQEGLLPVELMPAIVHMYDQKVVDLMKANQNQYNFTGKVVMYRIWEDHYRVVLSNVTVYQQSPAGSENTNKKGKKVANKLGKRVAKVDKLKIWGHDPINNSTLEQVDDKEAKSSPYFVEVEKKHVEKKKKLKLTKKKTVPVGYNPLIHTSLLGKRDKDMQRQDYSRPMPYNEKLRRARGSLEDAMAIADSQVGKVDVLKGRYRKKAKEYPHRCVESEERKLVDLRVVSGRSMVRRNYMVLMRSQDKFLSEMAVGAGGTLAMMAHNIHVAEEVMVGEERERVRESYGTRRKNKIEHATFDTVNNYAVVKEEPKKRVDTDSDSSEDLTSDEEFEIPELPVRMAGVGRPRITPERCRPKSRQVKVDSKEHLLGDDTSVQLGPGEMGDVGKDVINDVKVTQEVEDEFGFLDDLVEDKLKGDTEQDEQLAIDKMLDLALLDGNNNRDIEDMAVDQFELDDNVLREDCLQGGVLDLFNTHQDIFASTSLAELNQTLDTDI